MKILVISGSPKTNYSITLQTVLPCESHVINIREYPMRGGHINEGMIAPYKKVVEGAKR